MKVFRHRIWIVAVLAIGLAGTAWWLLRPNAIPGVVSTPAPLLTITVVKATHQNWPDTIKADGNLAAWQEAVISAETGSLRITKLLVDVGSVVRRGQLLAELSSASAAAEAQTRPPRASTSSARARSPTRCGGGSSPDSHRTPRLTCRSTRPTYGRIADSLSEITSVG